MLSGLKHLSVDLWPWPAQHDTSYAVYSTSSGVGAAERRRWSSSVSVSHTTPRRVATSALFLDPSTAARLHNIILTPTDAWTFVLSLTKIEIQQQCWRIRVNSLYTNCNDNHIQYLLYIAIYDQTFTLEYSYTIRMCLYCFINIVRLATRHTQDSQLTSHTAKQPSLVYLRSAMLEHCTEVPNVHYSIVSINIIYNSSVTFKSSIVVGDKGDLSKYVQ